MHSHGQNPFLAQLKKSLHRVGSVESLKAFFRPIHATVYSNLNDTGVLFYFLGLSDPGQRDSDVRLLEGTGAEQKGDQKNQHHISQWSDVDTGERGVALGSVHPQHFVGRRAHPLHGTSGRLRSRFSLPARRTTKAMAPSIKSAWKAYEAEEHERADSLFQEAASQFAGSPHPHTQRGLFLLRQERYSDASECFVKASEVNPDNPAPVFFLALSQELAGQRGDFRATLDRLKEISPHHQGRSSLELLAEIREGDPGELLGQFGFGPPSGKSPQKWTHRVAASVGKGDPEWLPSDLTSSDYLLGPILVEVEKRLHA